MKTHTLEAGQFIESTRERNETNEIAAGIQMKIPSPNLRKKRFSGLQRDSNPWPLR